MWCSAEEYLCSVFLPGPIRVWGIQDGRCSVDKDTLKPMHIQIWDG